MKSPGWPVSVSVSHSGRLSAKTRAAPSPGPASAPAGCVSRRRTGDRCGTQGPGERPDRSGRERLPPVRSLPVRSSPEVTSSRRRQADQARRSTRCRRGRHRGTSGRHGSRDRPGGETPSRPRWPRRCGRRGQRVPDSATTTDPRRRRPDPSAGRVVPGSGLTALRGRACEPRRTGRWCAATVVRRDPVHEVSVHAW